MTGIIVAVEESKLLLRAPNIGKFKKWLTSSLPCHAHKNELEKFHPTCKVVLIQIIKHTQSTVKINLSLPLKRAQKLYYRFI